MLSGSSQLLMESPRPLGLEMGKLLENWGRGLDKQACRTLLYNYLFRLEAYKKAKNQYFYAIREAKTSCWNNFLEKAQGKKVFTALKYTKEKTLRIVPSL